LGIQHSRSGRRFSQWTAGAGGSRGDAAGMDAEEMSRPSFEIADLKLKFEIQDWLAQSDTGESNESWLTFRQLSIKSKA
jgi:hypothetical protein